MRRIRCAEIWGGVHNSDEDVCTSGIRASLFSQACEGGRGGDVFYFSVCDSDRLTRVALADVMGHGAPVSRFSGWLYDSLAARMNEVEGQAVLADLNRAVDSTGDGMLATAAVVAFYLHTSRLYFAYAGHPPLLVRRRGDPRGWRRAELAAKRPRDNYPLGVADDAEYDQCDEPLSAGDRLFLFTDGLVDAPNAAGELFGDERLLTALRDCDGAELPTVKASVLDRVRRHTGGSLAHDDVTLLAMEVV